MPLTRTPYWDTRELHDFLLARKSTPFSWGTNDCSLFAADAILSYTGVDLADDFRGRYHDEASAIALCESVTGTATLEAAAEWCARKHGLVEWHSPKLAKRGDLVLVEDASRLISAVVHLNGRQVVTVGEDGLKVIHIVRPDGYTCNVKRAWAV